MTPYFTLRPEFAVNTAKPKPKRKDIDDIPENTRLGWALRLYGLGSLAWDYADTVLECAALLRRRETKKLYHAVKQVKLEYDRFRARILDNSYLLKETDIGLHIEKLCSQHLQKLHYGLKTEIAKENLEPNSVVLVEAVQQCLTLIDAMKLYAADCDKQVGDPGAHSVLPDHFKVLADLIAEFAGDAYNPNSETRSLTAKIIYNELKQLVLYTDNGIL